MHRRQHSLRFWGFGRRRTPPVGLVAFPLPLSELTGVTCRLARAPIIPAITMARPWRRISFPELSHQRLSPPPFPGGDTLLRQVPARVPRNTRRCPRNSQPGPTMEGQRPRGTPSEGSMLGRRGCSEGSSRWSWVSRAFPVLTPPLQAHGRLWVGSVGPGR